MTQNGISGTQAFEDAEQDAHVALVQAAQRFDPARGVPFLGYAVRRIQGGVVDGFRRRFWWSPSDHERGANQPFHINAVADYESFVAALRVGFEEELVERLAHEERLAWVAGHADLLTVRQREVLTEILAGAPTQRDIANRFGMTEANISHIVKGIAKRLRPHARIGCAECPSQFHVGTQAA